MEQFIQLLEVITRLLGLIYMAVAGGLFWRYMSDHY